MGEQTGTPHEPDLVKGAQACGRSEKDRQNRRIIEDFGGGLTKDLEDPAWAKQRRTKRC